MCKYVCMYVYIYLSTEMDSGVQHTEPGGLHEVQ